MRPSAGPRPDRRASGSRLRIPIALKYATLTSALLVCFMIVLGRTLLDLSLETADQQINDKGIKAALLVAVRTEPFWIQETPAGGARVAAQERLNEELKACLEDPAAEGLLDILIMDPEGKEFYASAREGRQVRLGDEREVASAEADRAKVKIVSGTVKINGSTKPARSYERALTSGGGVVGTVRVFLSAETIQRMQKAQTDRVTWIILVAVMVAIGVVVILGSWLTRPIRELKKDMAIVAAGDLFHQSKVRSGDEMADLAIAFNRMTAHLAEAHEREIERKALERELSIAAKIQTALLPEEIPQIPGFDVSAHCAPAREVGGDYYDIIPRGDNRYSIVVADVSGKGIPGSLVMTMTRSLTRMAARESIEPAELLIRVNASLSRDMTRGMFVTLVLADLDIRTSTLRIVRAGHNPVFFYRAATEELLAIQPPGIALGMDPGPVFAQTLKLQSLTLAPGDLVALYTDGIVEGMNRNGDEYTAERFAKVLKNGHARPSSEISTSVLSDLERHAAGAEPSDDVTLVILKREGSAA